MGKILVIRGGALGDFILTLPAIRLLRDAFPETEIEVLGYGQFVEIAEMAGLVDQARSIEYAKMAPFFARQTILEPELMDYFEGFSVVVSYLFDPDGHFSTNLARSGVETFLRGLHKPKEGGGHAALQLAEPLGSLAIFAGEPELRLEVEPDPAVAEGTLAIAPGSGSGAKNWPAGSWVELAKGAVEEGKASEVLLVTGEVEAANGVRDEVLAGLGGLPFRHLDQAPLSEVARALAGCAAYVGNDSGITHLAGALGVRTVALFGPTDPEVWGPVGGRVEVVCAPGGELGELGVGEVGSRI